MPYSSGPGGHTPPLPEVNFLMVEIPTPKPYIFMIRVTSQIKYLIAQALGLIPTPYKWNAPRVEAWGHPHPLPEVFFIAEYKTRPNDFDLQLVLVSCPKGQVKINVNEEACGKHL